MFTIYEDTLKRHTKRNPQNTTMQIILEKKNQWERSKIRFRKYTQLMIRYRSDPT